MGPCLNQQVTIYANTVYKKHWLNILLQLEY